MARHPRHSEAMGHREHQDQLVIEVRDRPDGKPRRWTLHCEPPGGDHPDPAAACAALAASSQPFEPVPEGRRCAQIWAGSEQAVVTGTWRGRLIHAEYRRTDACEEARWRALAPLLQPTAPTPRGTPGPGP